MEEINSEKTSIPKGKCPKQSVVPKGLNVKNSVKRKQKLAEDQKVVRMLIKCKNWPQVRVQRHRKPLYIKNVSTGKSKILKIGSGGLIGTLPGVENYLKLGFYAVKNWLKWQFLAVSQNLTFQIDILWLLKGYFLNAYLFSKTTK